MTTLQPPSGVRPSPNLLIDYRSLDGNTSRFCPTPLILKRVQGGFEPGKEQFWLGPEERGDCLCFTDDSHWILFHIDWSSLPESFGDGPKTQREARADKELTAYEAANWLDGNGHDLPNALKGRSLDPNGGETLPIQALTSGAEKCERVSRQTPKPATLSPPARAIAAAYELEKEGKPVSLKAACERAHVDRENLRKKHSGAAQAIRELAKSSRTPKRGLCDRRTGKIDAIDDPEE